jgi:hypothetical protein
MTELGLRQSYKRCVDNISKASTGLVTASTIGLVIPHLLLGIPINIYKLFKGFGALRKVKREAKRNNIRLRKRDACKGAFKGVLKKLGKTAVTIGHDDFMDMDDFVDMVDN